MEKRKNPEKDLRNTSVLFFNMGLFIALSVVVCAFEYRTSKTVFDPVDITNLEEDIPLILPTEIKPPPPPPKPKLKQIIEVQNDDVMDDPEEYQIDDLMDDPVEIEIPVDEPGDEPIIDAPIDIAEVMPEPEGGFEAFYSYIRKHLHYPAQARRMGIEGKVYVQFVVDKDGKLTDLQVIKGIGAGCDKEVMRIMEKAPDWKPGRQNGLRVKVRRVVPIDFRLN